jgi:uncharacterized protein (DUF2235 family)
MAAKNIIICSDGTGNSAFKARGTNVFKLYEAVDMRGHEDDPSLLRQIPIYDDGVGTQGFTPLRALSGATGLGVNRNLRQLYAELVQCYEPGDRLYLFGFSRGAYTVRALAGLIGECGILDKNRVGSHAELKERVEEAFAAFRELFPLPLMRRMRGKPSLENLRAFRKRWAHDPEAEAAAGRADSPEDISRPIHFLGVWDTVDAVGLPWDRLADLLNQIYPFRFPDRKLGRCVRAACHAVSIDDERRTFHPVLWDERDDPYPGRIRQVWFAGAHSNVGGGYPKQGMSLVALDWMAAEAAKAGLRFVDSDRQSFRDHQNVFDKLYDSREGAAAYYRYGPRDVAALCREHGVKPRIHASVFERIVQGTEGYAPGNIPRDCAVVRTGSDTPEDPALSRAVTPVLRRHFGAWESLAAGFRGPQLLRRFGHSAFLLASVAILGLWVLDKGPPATGLPDTAWLGGLAASLLGLPGTAVSHAERQGGVLRRRNGRRER